MKKVNFLKQVWDSKKSKDIKFSKMPKGKQDFINSDKPIEMGLKNSSGPENVKGLKKFDKKINKMADDLFGDEINTYMENTKQNRSKFDILYEDILNGMSEDDKLELGVPSDEAADDDTSFDDFDDDSGEETVSITLTKEQVKCLKAICDKLADEDVDDETDETEDFEDESEDWEAESEDEDEDVAEDTSFGEGIETEVVSPEKGKRYMNKAANKVGGKPSVKGGKANKGKIPAIKEDPEELSDERGKHYQKKEANKVKSSLNAGNDLF